MTSVAHVRKIICCDKLGLIEILEIPRAANGEAAMGKSTVSA